MFGFGRIVSNAAVCLRENLTFRSVQVRNINIGSGLGGEIPDSKRLQYALQHIHGIGRAKARHIVCELGVENKYVKDLSKRELYSLRELLAKYLIGNDFKKLVDRDIGRLVGIQCSRRITRELSQQIEKVMRALGDFLGVKVHACVGGTSVREDQRILQAGVHIVVGTPGRVFDMLRRQSLRSDCIKMFVLDEADEMLSRSFKDQIYDIFQLLPGKIQVGVFSVTMFPCETYSIVIHSSFVESQNCLSWNGCVVAGAMRWTHVSIL